MIEIVLNGETKALPAEQSIAELCKQIGAPASGIAVALNYELIPRAQYEKVVLRANDKVEIIIATAGG